MISFDAICIVLSGCLFCGLLVAYERTRRDSTITFPAITDYLGEQSNLERVKHGMFGYVRRWLRFGIACPKASSMIEIERVMRELGRRLKKIAYGWSDRGAKKMAKIILRKFTRQAEWDAYWKERTNTQFPHFQIRMDGRIMATSPELQ